MDFSALWNNAMDPHGFLGGVWNALKTIFKPIVEMIQQFFNWIGNLLGGGHGGGQGQGQGGGNDLEASYQRELQQQRQQFPQQAYGYQGQPYRPISAAYAGYPPQPYVEMQGQRHHNIIVRGFIGIGHGLRNTYNFVTGHGGNVQLAAQMQAESGGRIDAYSSADAMGVMQLREGTAKDMAKRLGVKYDRDRLLSDPEYNLRLGQEYMGMLREHYNGNETLALAAYNHGIGNMDKKIKKYGAEGALNHVPSETTKYIATIQKNERILQGFNPNMPRYEVASATLAPHNLTPGKLPKKQGAGAGTGNTYST